MIVLTENAPDAKIRLLTLALPLEGGDFVVARINGESVDDIFENLDIPDENIIAVFDTNNRLLFRSSIPPDKISLDVSHSQPILEARARGEGTYEARSEYDDFQRVYGFTRLESINGIVAVGVSSLVENAMKYTPAGGEIVISACRKDERIAVEVCDDRCGIRAEDVPRVFEKFYRGRPLDAECASAKDGDSSGENGYDGADAGVGLGLYLVRNLVEQIKGEITVESPADKNGRGAKFTIFLLIAS